MESIVLTPEQHESTLKDKDWRVREIAIKLGGLTPIQLERAMKDEDPYIRSVAKKANACRKLVPFINKLKTLVGKTKNTYRR